MALYDKRSFRHEGTLWVAEVHGAIGPVITGGTEYRGPAARESVIAIPVGSTSGVFFWIPGGQLNRLNHRAMIKLINTGKKMEFRDRPQPSNIGDIDEIEAIYSFKDHQGLRWGIMTAPQITQSGSDFHNSGSKIQYQCLDDSALRFEVGIKDSLSEIPKEVIVGVIPTALSIYFKDLPEDWFARD